MTDNTKLELPGSLQRAIVDYFHAATECPGADDIKIAGPKLTAAILKDRESYGTQREQEGIRKCIQHIGGLALPDRPEQESRYNAGVKYAKDSLRALLTPEAPKSTALETAIASLETARQHKLDGDDDYYTPALSEVELTAILEALSPAPSTRKELEK